MALIQNYAFDNMSRIGNDNCGLTERNILNSDHANWMLTNYFQNDCGMKKGLDFALSAPNINYTGSHQVGLGGCNIDQNSSLLIDPISRPACRISLFQRPFATVPFLGRGKVDAGMESELQQGDQISNRKTNTNIPNFLTPLCTDDSFCSRYNIKSCKSSGRSSIPWMDSWWFTIKRISP